MQDHGHRITRASKASGSYAARVVVFFARSWKMQHPSLTITSRRSSLTEQLPFECYNMVGLEIRYQVRLLFIARNKPKGGQGYGKAIQASWWMIPNSFLSM